MLQSIQKSSRFKEEYTKYKEAISKMPDGHFKEDVSNLLSKLAMEVKRLDEMHAEMIYTKQMPTLGTELRDHISSIRKQLETKLKDWKEASKV
jgi:gas vesicle protein